MKICFLILKINQPRRWVGKNATLPSKHAKRLYAFQWEWPTVSTGDSDAANLIRGRRSGNTLNEFDKDSDPNTRSPNTWFLLRLLPIPNALRARGSAALAFWTQPVLPPHVESCPPGRFAQPGPMKCTSAISPKSARERNLGSVKAQRWWPELHCLPLWLGKRSKENEEDWSAAERRATAQRKRKRRGGEARGIAGSRPLFGLDKNRMSAPA